MAHKKKTISLSNLNDAAFVLAWVDLDMAIDTEEDSLIVRALALCLYFWDSVENR